MLVAVVWIAVAAFTLLVLGVAVVGVIRRLGRLDRELVAVRALDLPGRITR